jgi:parvulin-like peptidyl-prolyl isomerase
MSKLLKEPLVHFLLVGLGLFLLNGYVGQGDTGEKTIMVDRPALLTFMQYRAKTFNPEGMGEILDRMSEEDMVRLVEDYVREEALSREALSLGLDENDYIIKKRLIQKLEFLTSGFVSASNDVSDEEIKNYYEEFKDRYFIRPIVTFTHVFFDAEKRGLEEAKALAEAGLIDLNNKKAEFSDAVKYGDRFPYHVNYVERELDFVASHFSKDFVEEILKLDVKSDTWAGPFESQYGYHLVLVADKIDGRYPKIDDIYDRVKADAIAEKIRKKSEKAIQEIVSQYQVIKEVN